MRRADTARPASAARAMCLVVLAALLVVPFVLAKTSLAELEADYAAFYKENNFNLARTVHAMLSCRSLPPACQWAPPSHTPRAHRCGWTLEKSKRALERAG